MVLNGHGLDLNAIGHGHGMDYIVRIDINSLDLIGNGLELIGHGFDLIGHDLDLIGHGFDFIVHSFDFIGYGLT